jgi:hypothetical protein
VLDPKVTWQEVVSLAYRLEDAAFRNDVSPDDGARLVRLVLQFDKQIIGSVRKAKPSTPPPAAGTG